MLTFTDPYSNNITLVLSLLYSDAYLQYDPSFRKPCATLSWITVRHTNTHSRAHTHAHWCDGNALNTFTRAREYGFRRYVVTCCVSRVLLPFTGVLLHHCYSNNGLNQSGWLNPTRAVVAPRTPPKYADTCHSHAENARPTTRVFEVTGI